MRREFAGGVRVIDGITLDVPAGQFVAILGPSGCGKSTLLRLVAGLDTPDGGSLEVGAPREPGSIAFVFQDAHLLPWRDALGNAALPLELAGVPSDERLQRARDALVRVGLADALDRRPAQLSGGMRMRVSLARALVTKPRILLLDEPFAALDEITRHELDAQLLDLWQAERTTVVFVTHSTSEAAFLAERAVVLSRRPARVVLDVPIALGARVPDLRTTPEFGLAMASLSAALESGLS